MYFHTYNQTENTFFTKINDGIGIYLIHFLVGQSFLDEIVFGGMS